MGDPLAQLVEHHTFNVGVLGSNPKRITKRQKGNFLEDSLFLAYKQTRFLQNLFIGHILNLQLFCISRNSVG